MKSVLEILPVNLDAKKCTLVFEISNEGFSYAIKDDNNVFVAIAVFYSDKNTGNHDYSAILQNELQQQQVFSENFKEVYIMYSFGESVMIPFSLYNSLENTNVLNGIHGDLQSNESVFTDILPEIGIYNSYRIPTSVFEVVKSKFPHAVNRHQYSVLLKQPAPEEDKLVIIFYPKKVVMMLHTSGATQFINTFSYDTINDVLYILLNTCKQFEIKNIPVEINGMLEMNSALSKEIHKYFTVVSFTKLPADCNYSEEITKHPAHYFSYILGVDSCE